MSFLPTAARPDPETASAPTASRTSRPRITVLTSGCLLLRPGGAPGSPVISQRSLVLVDAALLSGDRRPQRSRRGGPAAPGRVQRAPYQQRQQQAEHAGS